MKYLKLAAVALAIIALGLTVRPTSAAGNCSVSPSGSGEVGTTFWISCGGFAPNIWTNVYAVEPDGRASGINAYGFFPTEIKADENGVATFYFKSQIGNLFSVPVGRYTFVVHALTWGNAVVNEQQVDIELTPHPEAHTGAWLESTVNNRDVSFTGGGFAPWEMANVWVTQPDAVKCSGIGTDQLTLGALAANAATLWDGPGTVKADADGNIAFSMHFNSSACIGEYAVTVRAPGSWRAAETYFTINGNSVTESGGAWLKVTPDSVLAYRSALTIWGGGFGAYQGVNCWFTRPDGRVITFINVDAKTDAGGSFSVAAHLDDFPPDTSTDPGTWYATCATPNHSFLATTWFTVQAPVLDP